MGRIYRRLGVYDKAQPLLEQALAIGRPVFGPEHVRLAQRLNDLGVLLIGEGRLCGRRTRPGTGAGHAAQAAGPEHADVAVTLVELARVYQDQGFNERAEPLQREALAIRRKVLGDEHRETAASLSGLASVLRLNGDLAGAESLLRQCLETNRKTLGRGSSEHGHALERPGADRGARGDYPAAESLFRQALVKAARRWATSIRSWP